LVVSVFVSLTFGTITSKSNEINVGRMKVCWQVTGSRKDPWAAANPFEVEQEKPQDERGRYLHPDLYDASEEQRVRIAPVDEERLRQMMRQEPPPGLPKLPPEEPPQPPAMPPTMPPAFDLVRQHEEHRQQIEELNRSRLEEEIDELRRQIKKLRRGRKR
jgi:hypothetical protein